MSGDEITQVINLLNLRKKSEIVKLCRDLTISSDSLAKILFSAKTGVIKPYLYANHFAEITPNDLEITKEQLNALGRAKPGKPDGKALKCSTKIDQQFKTRKLLNIHLLYLPDNDYWHIFYFSQRDYSENKNHWNYGSHIHYYCKAHTNRELNEIWQLFTSSKPKLPSGEHIKYSEQ